ncbi:MAG TPA: TetR/AcrR family transcriptional regulator [Burkholderiaceae bacterium]|nr:TetR/AcrR family transcriptional regulator [Burkholderiaceae bacterium]
MRVKTEAKREAILEVASQVFLELGYERASMDEIAARGGGSKVTLYGYFSSKHQLFLAVVDHMAAHQLGPAFDELVPGGDDLAGVLRRFGEKFLAFICTPEAVGAYRMVAAQPLQSGVGRDFFEVGPKRGQATVTAYLQSEMAAGRLQQADAAVAALHLMALLGAEAHQPLLMGATTTPTRQRIKQMVERAVTVFMAAYAS